LLLLLWDNTAVQQSLLISEVVGDFLGNFYAPHHRLVHYAVITVVSLSVCLSRD